MFNWFYKRISRGIMSQIDFKEIFFEILNDEEMQKWIVELTDTLYDRYKSKVLGTIGGLQKGLNFAQNDSFPNIIDSKGKISLKGILPVILKGFMGNKSQTEAQPSNTPKELLL